MPKADTSVKWFHSGMPGAPVLRGEPGALIEVLDACLINGFSTRSPDSVVVAGGVATVSISAGNPYDKHAVIAISGASEAALNASWRIDTSAATSFTFLCPGVADGTVTGASVKRAAAGWAKPFSDTNVAVYQSLDPNSTQLYLQVLDTDARYSRVRGYEGMTDANTGTGGFPLISKVAAYTWPKSSSADTVVRSWALASDGSFFYWLPLWFVNTLSSLDHCASILFFGDVDSFNPNDRYHCALSGHWSAAPSQVLNNYSGAGKSYQEGSYGTFIARDITQTGQASPIIIEYPTYSGYWSAPAAFSGAQPTTDGRKFFTGFGIVYDGGSRQSNGTRGLMPGVINALLSEWDANLSFFTEELDESCVILRVRAGVLERSSSMDASTVTVATANINILGPWR